MSGPALAARRKDRAACDADPVAGRQPGRAAEDIATGRVDAVENSMTSGEHAGYLEPQAPREHVGQRAPHVEHRARARRLERHQGAPRTVAARLGDVRFGHAEAVEI